MKDLEEAAREYENKELHIEDGEYTSTAIIEAFTAGVAFAQKWISCEDKSPKKGDRVLLKDKDGEVECLLIYNEDYVTYLMERFTHWRYIELK